VAPPVGGTHAEGPAHWIVVGLLIAVLAVIIVRMARPWGHRGGTAPQGTVAATPDQDLRRTLARSLHRLERGDDARTAIIDCWVRLEEVAEARGSRRRRSDTTEEYTLALLHRTTLPASDLEALADLYRTAMFASDPPDEAARRQAVAVLDRLLAALEPDR